MSGTGSTRIQGAAATSLAGMPRNYSLDILRIVSICGVVAIHVFGWFLGAAPKSHRLWWLAAAIDIGFIWVVPVFVMISGALVLGSRQAVDQPLGFYKKRALRLVPALLAWNLIYLLGVRIWMRGEDLTGARILQLLFDGSVFTQLYFLWLILGLYAVAPLLATFLRGGGPRRAACFAIVVLALTVAAYTVPGLLGLAGIKRPITLNFLTHWMPYVGYFLAGFALRNVRLNGLRLAGVAIVTLMLGIFTVWHYGHRGLAPVLDAVSPVSYLGAGVCLLSLGVFVTVQSAVEKLRPGALLGRTVVELSNASFGVFLVHLVVFEAIRLQYESVNAGTSFAAIAAAWGATVIISFGLSFLALRVPYIRRIF